MKLFVHKRYFGIYKTPRSFKNAGFSLGFTLIEIITVVTAISILIAIALPNLMRNKRTANEVFAKTTLRTISTACENFSVNNNGAYPAEMADLTESDPPLLNLDYTASNYQGYSFSCSSLTAGGYECSAAPLVCGVSGNKTITISTGSVFTEEDCA